MATPEAVLSRAAAEADSRTLSCSLQTMPRSLRDDFAAIAKNCVSLAACKALVTIASGSSMSGNGHSHSGSEGAAPAEGCARFSSGCARFNGSFDGRAADACWRPLPCIPTACAAVEGSLDLKSTDTPTMGGSSASGVGDLNVDFLILLLITFHFISLHYTMQLMSLSRAPPSRSRNWRSGPPSRCMPTKECTKQMVKMKVPLSTPTTTCQAIPSTINHSISCSMSIRGASSCSIHALVPPCVHGARGARRPHFVGAREARRPGRATPTALGRGQGFKACPGPR